MAGIRRQAEHWARCLVLFVSAVSVVTTVQRLPSQVSLTLQAFGFITQITDGLRMAMFPVVHLFVFTPLALLMEGYLILLMLREINQAPSIWHWRSFRKRWPLVPIVLGVAVPIALLPLLGIGLQLM